MVRCQQWSPFVQCAHSIEFGVCHQVLEVQVKNSSALMLNGFDGSLELLNRAMLTYDLDVDL